MSGVERERYSRKDPLGAPVLRENKGAGQGRTIWGIIKILFCLALFFLLAGTRPACDRRAPTITTCSDFAVDVEPGTCVDITNPCDPSGDFFRFDGFRFCGDEPDGVFVRTVRSRSRVTRQICASSDVAMVTNEPVTYVYSAPPSGQGVSEFGQATVFITTDVAPPPPPSDLAVTASANPTAVANPGDAMQLFADATGGTGPYSFLWTMAPQSNNPPDGGIAAGDETLQNPWATPLSPTEYTVVVTDANGNTASASVRVSVGFTVWADANPTEISAGESTQLSATVVGGTPPYTYQWGGPGIDNMMSPYPTATPTESVEYQIFVFDSIGNFAFHSVQVSVAMVVDVIAVPAVIDFGDPADLLVFVQGGTYPYTFEWTPADGLDPSDLNNPFPTVHPSASVTYQMSVTDFNGDVAVGSVYLHVNEPGPVNAYFTVTPDPPDLGGADELWDASGSSGEGTLQYRWVFTCPYEASCTQCFGANAVINPDGSVTPDPADCNSVTFHPGLQTLPNPLDPPQQFRSVTLIVEDTSTGLRDGKTVMYNLF